MKSFFVQDKSGCLKAVLVDDEDFPRVISRRWSYCTGAIISGSAKTIISLGRFILNYTGPFEIDHKDTNPWNNQKSNLRIATKSQNQANRPKYNQYNATSKYKGVRWHKRSLRWIARIKFKHKEIYLGQFSNEHEAAKAYNNAAIKYFGEFSYLNIIVEEDKNAIRRESPETNRTL